MRRNRTHQSRLSDLEVLEPRVTLSHAPSFGAVGDSLTDEYRFYPPDRSHARNWVENLAATRHVNFGSYTTKSRGEPRDQGFAQNWAKSAATSSDVVSSQLAGLTHQVQSGRVTYAAVNMGTNDFLFFLEAEVVAAQTETPAGFEAKLASVEATAITNLDLTVSTLLAANPAGKVIVATIPDVRAIPIVAQNAGIPAVAAASAAIYDAETVYNTEVRSLAQAQPGRVAVADIASEQAAILGASAQTTRFGGITLRLAASGANFHDFTVGDQIHPGTIGQGLIANAVIDAADSLGATIKPLTPADIVRYARSVASH